MKKTFLLGLATLVFAFGCEEAKKAVLPTVPTELTLKGTIEGQTLNLSSKKMVNVNGASVPEVSAFVRRQNASDPETLAIAAYIEGQKAFMFSYYLKPGNAVGDYTGFNGTGTMAAGQVANGIIDLTSVRVYDTFNSTQNSGKIETLDRTYRRMKVSNSGTAQRYNVGELTKVDIPYSFTIEGLVVIQ